jgi:hypothetical protein
MAGIPRHRWDLTGQQFGRWTVISRAASDHHNRYFWNCRCVCGGTAAVSSNSLRRGHSQSCGCLKLERLIAAVVTHGHSRRGSGKHSKSGTYRCWQNMLARCLRPQHPKFHNHGGRGITICSQWIESFEQFLADMGEQPPGLTLERIDNDGNYEPTNCRWATYLEQNRNHRRNHRLTVGNETLVLEDWAKRLGTAPSTITGRMQRGWAVEEAATLPLGQTHLARRRAEQAGR